MSVSSGFTRRTVIGVVNHPLVRVEQYADIFSLLERAEEQQVAASWRQRPRRPFRCARRTDGNPITRDPEPLLELSGRKRRRDDHCVGATRMIADQRGVVAANLSAGPLGMREEVEIVNR